MRFTIKELRESTGMTQKGFSQMYGIPISTLRKWEQGESSPAPYVVNLLARTLPSTDSALQKITGKNGVLYYYDKNQKMVSDMQGNKIMIQEDLDGVKEQNLALYLSDLFEGFYEIQEKFNRDCKYDKEEDILWT
jgi:transcriptional regulator with XRE-family HTH domain